MIIAGLTYFTPCLNFNHTKIINEVNAECFYNLNKYLGQIKLSTVQKSLWSCRLETLINGQSKHWW